MTRFEYFMFTMLLNIFLALFDNNPLLAILLVPVYILISCERFKDIGMTRWWIFGTLIPVINLYPLFNLTFASTGYKIENHENYNKVDGWHSVGFIIIAFFMFVAISVAIRSY